ncbi:MAG TPA: FlgD immunoglobulin-like domain containing protein, partial [Candidatus Krumholzibacteria bacterium]|nr:FlgD immunoglobulin-like domain containing protein [Candidatus Krumholzibacteria bacterium]
GKPNFTVSTPDGSGGAYFAWVDARSAPEFGIYLQRVDGAGNPQWAVNGISLGTSHGTYQSNVLCGDGEGGAIVVWRDFRADTAGNLYANRVNPAGVLQWGAAGVAVSLGARHEERIVACSDGAGGVFVAWQDDRDSIRTIRAQRVDPEGNLLWPADGVVAAPSGSDQRAPRIAADGMGGVLIGWSDQQQAAGAVFAQRLSGAGARLWAPFGVQLCTSAFNNYLEAIAADGSGGALAVWQDNRSQNLWAQAFAQRVDASGNLAWAVDGVSLSGTTYPVQAASICSDGQGGAIVEWDSYENNGWHSYMAQRLSPSGTKLWALPGIEAGRGYDGSFLTTCRIFSDGAGGAVFGWVSGAGGDSILAQRLGPLGNKLWSSEGVVLAALSEPVWQLGFVPDGSGGAIGHWLQEDGVSGGYSVAAQRVNGSGTLGVPSVPISIPALTCVPTPARARAGVELRFASRLSNVQVQIFDLGGRLIRTLHETSRTPAGARWDGRDAGGHLAAPGIYAVRVLSGETVARGRLVIIE